MWEKAHSPQKTPNIGICENRSPPLYHFVCNMLQPQTKNTTPADKGQARAYTWMKILDVGEI